MSEAKWARQGGVVVKWTDRSVVFYAGNKKLDLSPGSPDEVGCEAFATAHLPTREMEQSTMPRLYLEDLAETYEAKVEWASDVEILNAAVRAADLEDFWRPSTKYAGAQVHGAE